MKSYKVRDDAHWHELRAQHLGGSEVAALFNEHNQLTKYELWHIKKGLLPQPDLSDNERVFWGTILEPAIAEGVARRTGWKIQKVRRYHSLPDIRLGASLDFEIVAHDRGPGVLEIKTADWLVARAWEEDEPPLSYMLQVQSYMACTGRDWGVMAVLVGGNDLRLFEYERRPKTIDLIKTEVASFWQSIDAGQPPKPDFETDAATVSKIYSTVTDGKTVDMSQSNRLPELCSLYKESAASEKAAKTTREATRAEIFSLIEDAHVVTCGDYKISAGAVSAIPDKIITEAMIGQPLKGRSGYRGFHLSERKAKAKAA